MPQILPLFPKRIRVFADLFCGGGNVGINISGPHVIYNDRDRHIAALLRLFRERTGDEIVEGALSLIAKYGLSLSLKHGYGCYGCESSTGLGAYNRKGFLALRNEYNRIKDNGTDPYSASLMLYVLVVYAFNNQLRFNSSGAYNLPVGKRDFNPKMESKLRRFAAALRFQDCEIESSDFRDFNINGLDERDLVYVDPPYLITCATYNENGGWDEGAERDLLDFLDRLTERKVRFALSNVLAGKGKVNLILEKWARDRQHRVHHLKEDYSNSNYHRIDRAGFTDEVLVTNYEM